MEYEKEFMHRKHKVDLFVTNCYVVDNIAGINRISVLFSHAESDSHFVLWRK